MTLILPGVEIQVVKEIVVPQLNPAGILGLIGICEDDEDGNVRPVARETSYKGLKGLFGKAIEFTVPEAKQAYQNGVSEICMVPIESGAATPSTYELRSASGKVQFRFTARAKGLWGNDIKIKFEPKEDDDGNITLGTLALKCGDSVEFYDNLVMLDRDHDRYLPKIVNAGSDIVSVTNPDSKGKKGAKDEEKGEEADEKADKKAEKKDEKKEEKKEEKKAEKKDEKAAPAPEVPSGAKEMPLPVETKFAGGRPATMKDFETALEQLESQEDVDLVAAHIEDFSDMKVVKAVYAAMDAHCKVMSNNCMNRIAFGEVPPSETFKDALEEVNAITKLTNTMASDRFILIAPHGGLGAVVGLIGNLPVHYSPTWKTLTGLTGLERNYSPSNLMALLKSNILALEVKKGKGIIVEKGICTSGEQISVQRVADRAVRGTKMIGDLFIGTLNNMTGRAALKEKITEFFIQMEKDGAIVPSADGSDPSYKVDVYASNDDVSKGIVRVDVAIRPVRAIDYIYGTILVRA